MLDPQYLQESTTENDDNLPSESIPEELVKSEFPHVFGPPASPNSHSGLAEKLENSPGLDGKIRKESIMNNATKICLKFQLSNPPSTSGKYLLTRYRPKFFDQVGHQTTYASMGNKHFITK